MITIKDLEKNGKWLTPEQRADELHHERDSRVQCLPLYSECHEYRLHLSLKVIQYFNEKSSLVRDKEQVRKEIEYKAKRIMLRKLYSGIHERYGRIMELREFLCIESRMYPIDYINKVFSPITEILNIVNGQS